jgi:phage-related holin
MEALTHISFWAAIKNSGYVAVFLASAHYLNLSPESAAVLGILITTDVVTGVLKSGTVNGWKSIRSSIMERGLVAKCLLIVAPITLAVAGKGIGVDLSTLAQTVVSLLILSEAYSIIGNIYAVRTGKITNEFDAVAYVLEGLKTLLKKVIVEDTPTTLEK